MPDDFPPPQNPPPQNPPPQNPPPQNPPPQNGPPQNGPPQNGPPQNPPPQNGRIESTRPLWSLLFHSLHFILSLTLLALLFMPSCRVVPIDWVLSGDIEFKRKLTQLGASNTETTVLFQNGDVRIAGEAEFYQSATFYNSLKLQQLQGQDLVKFLRTMESQMLSIHTERVLIVLEPPGTDPAKSAASAISAKFSPTQTARFSDENIQQSSLVGTPLSGTLLAAWIAPEIAETGGVFWNTDTLCQTTIDSSTRRASLKVSGPRNGRYTTVNLHRIYQPHMLSPASLNADSARPAK